jgi:putative transposase
MPFPREIDEGRVMRGQEIARLEGQIKRLDESTYEVNSQSGHGLYTVVKGYRDWSCSCPDHVYREVKCKHIWGVEFSLKLRDKVRENVVIQPIAINTCLYCQSASIVKNGLRHNKYGDIQVFQCNSCGRDFTVNLGFEHMKHNPHAVTTAMQLYFSGESLRNTARSLRMMGVEVSYQTVWNWIQKYTGLMEKYLDKITPQVSNTWRADELYVKIRGNMKYVFAMMDDETRFWIAQEVANTKDTHDASNLFQMARDRAGKKPSILVTDGLRSYRDAWLKEYRTNKQSDSTVHIRQITLAGHRNNNKMERMNGEIRDREKVTRNLKIDGSPILTGMQLFHNYVRPHMGLHGKTPADLAGIKVEGENKWLTLIQNASKKS